MFNPLYPFTQDVLVKTVERGCHYFVRNKWPHAFDHFNDTVKEVFIISHYNEEAKAKAHFNSISNDPYRFLYNWNIEAHQAKLKTAASFPPGYSIFSSYFVDDYKKRITNNLKDKINRYMYRHTSWKPGKGETVFIDFYLQFGSLYITMAYGGHQIKVKFKDIENER